MSNLQILVCGDVDGHFRKLFFEVDSILREKAAFECLFCVGNFFGDSLDEYDDLKAGKIKVPITTYILGPNKLNHVEPYNTIDSVPNITYLGAAGCLTMVSGLKVAYISGIELPKGCMRLLPSKSDAYLSRKDVRDLIFSLKSETVIDILLTSQWPKDVTKYTVSVDKRYDRKIDNNSSYAISNTAIILKPRYHFCGLEGLYYERVPYRNHAVLQETPRNVTRFFALSSIENTKKEQWLYALTITPATCLSFKELTDTTGPVTLCPYELNEAVEKAGDILDFLFLNECGSASRKRARDKSHENQSKKLSIDASACSFCLTNSNVEKEIISRANHCYLTLAKGTLTPEHVLIVPIKHGVSYIELSSDVSEEVAKYKCFLSRYFHDKNKDVIFFERNYSSPHLQIQVVPVPKDKEDVIRNEIFISAQHYNLEFIELPSNTDIEKVIITDTPYFHLQHWIDRYPGPQYLHIVKQEFPLQFGRIVLASSNVLNVEHRINSQVYQDPPLVEKEKARLMRKYFARYDFARKCRFYSNVK